MRRRAMHLLLMIPLALVLFCGWLMLNERRLIYYPSRELSGTPAEAGLPYEDVRLTTADNVPIHGWFVPAFPFRIGKTVAANPATNRPPITILFFHGNAGNISYRLEKLAVFHGLGASTLIIDYRGYGQSAGRPNEAGTYADAEAAFRWLMERPAAAAPPRIVLYGESLGTAVAVELATRHPTAGVILEEPFASVAAMGHQMFPFLPLSLLVRNRYDSLRKIDHVNAPLLIFHSVTDEVIPYRQGQRLFERAREPKTFVSLHGSHDDAFLNSSDTYRASLEKFLSRATAETPRK